MSENTPTKSWNDEMTRQAEEAEAKFKNSSAKKRPLIEKERKFFDSLEYNKELSEKKKKGELVEEETDKA